MATKWCRDRAGDARPEHAAHGGIEFLEELRGDPALRRILVFVMTTSAAVEDRMKAYDMNVAAIC